MVCCCVVHLILSDCVYLDHAGATLASRSQLTAVHRSLCGELLANPHSASAAGRAVAERIERARAQVR